MSWVEKQREIFFLSKKKKKKLVITVKKEHIRPVDYVFIDWTHAHWLMTHAQMVQLHLALPHGDRCLAPQPERISTDSDDRSSQMWGLETRH